MMRVPVLMFADNIIQLRLGVSMGLPDVALTIKKVHARSIAAAFVVCPSMW